MKEVVVIDCVRTPMGRSKNGVFRNVRAEDLSAALMTALLERNPGVNPAEIEDIICCLLYTSPSPRDRG